MAGKGACFDRSGKLLPVAWLDPPRQPCEAAEQCGFRRAIELKGVDVERAPSSRGQPGEIQEDALGGGDPLCNSDLFDASTGPLLPAVDERERRPVGDHPRHLRARLAMHVDEERVRKGGVQERNASAVQERSAQPSGGTGFWGVARVIAQPGRSDPSHTIREGRRRCIEQRL